MHFLEGADRAEFFEIGETLRQNVENSCYRTVIGTVGLSEHLVTEEAVLHSMGPHTVRYHKSIFPVRIDILKQWMAGAWILKKMIRGV